MTDTLNNARFRKFGQGYHIQIKTAADLAILPDLDEAHWVASGTSTESIHTDPVFESYLDTDGNKRIMCFEVKDAITWLLDTLSDHSGIEMGSSTLHLNSINTESRAGSEIRNRINIILSQIGLPDAEEITLDQIRGLKAKIEKTPVSEAGVVLPAAATGGLRDYISDIVDTLGGADHPGGEKGVNEEILDKFVELARARLAWHERSVIPEGSSSTELMPLGRDTFDAYNSFAVVKEKIDQYFAQCEAVTVNKQLMDYILADGEDLEKVDITDPAALEEFLKSAPLTAPTRDVSLHFGGEINLYYAEAIEQFRTKVVNRVLSRPVQRLTKKEWLSIKQFLAVHSDWISEKKGAEVEKLGLARIREHLKSSYYEGTRKLIDESRSTALELQHIRQVEKLVLYQANMMNLVNNFVSFPYLYDPECRAVFEMGTFIIDGRHLNFSVLVDNRNEHVKVAESSNIFILYVEVMPGSGRKSYEVAVPVTSGGKGNLCIGKRGVFRDIHGVESDARVVHIIENPISISETLAAPFIKLGSLLTGKIESITAAAEKKLDTVGTEPGKLREKQVQAAAPSANLLMGGSVALAALSSAFAFVTKTLSGIHGVDILIGILVAILAVMAPASVVAMIKLRKRDLSAILEGSGWAINGRMRLTFNLGRFFTCKPRRPGKDLISIS